MDISECSFHHSCQSIIVWNSAPIWFPSSIHWRLSPLDIVVGNIYREINFQLYVNESWKHLWSFYACTVSRVRERERETHINPNRTLNKKSINFIFIPSFFYELISLCVSHNLTHSRKNAVHHSIYHHNICFQKKQSPQPNGTIWINEVFSRSGVLLLCIDCRLNSVGSSWNFFRLYPHTNNWQFSLSLAHSLAIRRGDIFILTISLSLVERFQLLPILEKREAWSVIKQAKEHEYAHFILIDMWFE